MPPTCYWWHTFNFCEKASGTEFFECTRDAFLIQYIMESTCYRINQALHLLDLIFSNEEWMERVIIEWSRFSDQCNETFIYERGNCGLFREMLRDDWETRFENLDVEESVEILTSMLEKVEHECIPKKKSKQAGKYKPLWINTKTLHQVRKKWRTWKKYLITKDGRGHLE